MQTVNASGASVNGAYATRSVPGGREDLALFIEGQPAGRHWLVLHVDLANFRLINRMVGAAVGDRILDSIGRALCLDGRHHWFRINGDVWVGICEGRAPAVGLSQVPSLRAAMKAAGAAAASQSLRLDASIGIAVGVDVESALLQADAACRAAKKSGRPQVRVSVEQDMVGGSSVVRALLAGKPLDGHLQLHHQRIEHFDASAHYELLARSDGVSLGPVIPTIEQMGLAHTFDMAVVRMAVDQVPAGAHEHAINLSAASICDNQVVLEVISALRGRSNLSIEITETAVMEDPVRARLAIEMLRRADVPVYLDDYGEGSTSLSMLDLPFSAMKLGTGLTSDACSTDILESVVRLMRRRNMLVIGEGIETQGQLKRLRDAGAHAAQGYLLHRPEAMPG